MERLAPLAGKPALAGTFRARRRRLADIVNREGWDGRWYLMAFNDDGDRIGSAACPDGGRVFLNPQSWAVLAGVADARRTRTVMRACDEQLKFDAGYLCFAPMYSRFDPGVGRISLWPSEGGSVYTHAVIFKISADCLLGEGDRAWETLRRVVPMGGLLPLSESGAEPFVVPNAYMGPQWPNPKSSYQGWWTASADWVLQVLVEQILGACADYDGLRIDPCLPRAMTRARIERHFRGSTYDIRITKPNGICRGKVTLRVDGKRMSGNLIKPDTQPGRHIVEAVIEEESHAHSSET
jgi:cellobiose phosphorylase